MNFDVLAQTRQSARSYIQRKISREDITKILDSARLAPSACNSQPWRPIVVDDPAMCEKIAHALQIYKEGLNKFSTQISTFIVMADNKSKDYNLRWLQFDLGAITNYICLQAADMGIASCMMGAFDEAMVKELLHVPEESRLYVIVGLGYSESMLRPKARKTIAQAAGYNDFYTDFE